MRFAPWPERVDSPVLRKTLVAGIGLLGVMLMVFASMRLFSQPATGPAGQTAAGGPQLATHVLNPQRFPEAMAAGASDQALRNRINGIIASKKMGSGPGSLSVAISRNGYDLMKHNSDQPLTPASTLKILTAGAAIDLLGADTRFATDVRAASPDTNGTLAGNLYLVGGGDPLLQTSEFTATLEPGAPSSSLDALADSVAASGIRRVAGDIVGDDSRFDNQTYLPSWPATYGISGQVGAISALNVNQGYVRFIGGRVPASDPTILSAELFRSKLAARGVAVEGGATKGQTPSNLKTVSSLDSVTVNEAAREMLTHSDNTIAEVLVKNIGVARQGNGTTGAGTKAIREWARGFSPTAATLETVDGSGLDRSDKASCDTIDDTLAKISTQPALREGMPKAGESGTLEDRMVGTAAVGRVQAKTGSLVEVSSLAGWANPPGQDLLRFCVITNGYLMAPARQVEDAIAVALATGVESPPVSLFDPGIARVRG